MTHVDRNATSTVHLVGVDDPAWDRWLTLVAHDVYHTAGYHRCARDAGEGEPLLVVVGDVQRAMAWPYLLRPIDAVRSEQLWGRTDVSSVYGYPGPLVWGGTAGDPFILAAWKQILAAWREQGVVAAFTRFHPLLENASIMAAIEWPPRGVDDPTPVVDLGQTVSIDLAAGPDAARAGYSGSVRRQIRRYRGAGLRTTEDAAWEHLDEFVDLYRATMLRAGADEYYLFGKADLTRWKAALGDRIHLLITRLGREIGAAGLFFELGGTLQLHLVATNVEMQSVSPYKVLLDDAVDWGYARGASVLHLGGGRGARMDSLFEFKRRFSSRRHTFSIGRWILDEDAYRDLTRAHIAEVAEVGVPDGSYFPAYRAPVSPDGPAVAVGMDRADDR
jgi:hypothetical protein